MLDNAFIERQTAMLMKQYAECIESFLKTIGVDASSAGEYELRTLPGEMLPQELWKGDVKVAEITTRLETTDGYRYVVECLKITNN